MPATGRAGRDDVHANAVGIVLPEFAPRELVPPSVRRIQARRERRSAHALLTALRLPRNAPFCSMATARSFARSIGPTNSRPRTPQRQRHPTIPSSRAAGSPEDGANLKRSRGSPQPPGTRGALREEQHRPRPENHLAVWPATAARSASARERFDGTPQRASRLPARATLWPRRRAARSSARITTRPRVDGPQTVLEGAVPRRKCLIPIG